MSHYLSNLSLTSAMQDKDMEAIEQQYMQRQDNRIARRATKAELHKARKAWLEDRDYVN